jgi:prepilin-type N-terminal cleavage/methylation domain-containing protein
MKTQVSKRRNRGLTFIEVLVVIFVLAILVAMLLPANHGGHRKWAAWRISCVSNLKQIGMAYRIWGGDNNGNYPMSVSVTNGGVMEILNQNPWMTYLVMSNELSTPKILFCPADTVHFPTTSFSAGFSAQNISYFIGLNADETNPQMLLSGDDNFAIGGVPVKSGRLDLAANMPVTWTAARHHFAGNVAVADGSVQQMSNSGLTNWLHQTGLATNRLAIP